MERNYYNILELKQFSTLLEIKKSYRQLILKWHPDKNDNSESARKVFLEIQEAYENINDENKKMIYDISLLRFRKGEEKRLEEELEKIKLERSRLKLAIEVKRKLKEEPEIELTEIPRKYWFYREFISSLNNLDKLEEFKNEIIGAIQEAKQARERKTANKKQELKEKLIKEIDQINSLYLYEIARKYCREQRINCSCFAAEKIQVKRADFIYHVEKCIGKDNNLIEVESFVSKIILISEDFLLNLRKTKESYLNKIEKILNVAIDKHDITKLKFIVRNQCECRDYNDYEQHINNHLVSEEDLINFENKLINSIENFKETRIEKRTNDFIAKCWNIWRMSSDEIDELIREGNEILNEKLFPQEKEKIEAKLKELKEKKEIIADDYSSINEEDNKSEILLIKEIAKIVLPEQNRFSYNGLLKEIIYLKKESLKNNIFQKRKILKDLKEKLSQKIENKETKKMFNYHFFQSHERHIFGNDYKNFHKRNINYLKKFLSEEEINSVIKKQEEIISIEKQLSDLFKINSSKLECFQEVRSF